MKADLIAVVIGLAGLGLVGCLPEERILWAPDASKALVLSGDRLFLTDPAGKLTAVGEGIAAANWMKDSRRLVVARKAALLTWRDATAVLPEARQVEVAALSAKLRADLLAYEGDWDKYQLNIAPEHGGDLALMLLYLRDHYGPELSAKLGERWKQVGEADVEVLHLCICPAEASAAMGPTLAVALACESPQASPDGKAIAYWGRPVEKAMAENALMVVAADGAGGTQRVVAERTAAWAAWSADGRYLACSAANLPKAGGDESVLRLGTVGRSMIFDEKGDMPPEEKGFTREDLAGVLFHEEGKVACLPDGRILFSGASVELPATSADMPQQMSLFIVAPGGPSVVKALSRQEQGQLVDPLMCFAVSPSGTRVAIQGNTGQVAVASLADGTVRVIQAAPAGGKASRIVPAWRSDDELSFVAPADSAGTDRAEVVLAKLTAERVTRTTLSQDWPQAARLGLLEEPPAASQPASDAQRPGTATQPASDAQRPGTATQPESVASPVPTTGPTTRK